MRLTLKLAWRNIWRSRRRTVLTLLTILVGSAMIILINAFAKGGHDTMIRDAVAMNTGQIQVHEKGYWENLSIDYAFVPDASLMAELENAPEVKGYAKRIHAGGLLAFKESSKGVLIQGIDPVREKGVTNLHTKILPGGRYLREGDLNHAVMGSALAKNMGAAVGDEIAFISQGFDGSIAAEKLMVTGLVKSGNPALDRELLLIPLALAEEAFSMMGYYHALTLSLSEIEETKGVVERLKAAGGEGIEVMGWDELMPELVQFIVMDDISGYIFDFILFVVVAFGVLNTIQMSVLERTREFGVMLAIGTRPGQLTAMILAETAVIALMGIVLGATLGSLISWYFAINPIDYSAFEKEIAVWGMTTTLFPADVTLRNVASTSAITFICAMLFAVFPARRAAGLDPVTAIRHI